MKKSTASLCKGCGRLIIERDRKPCGKCGCLNRVVARTTTESIGAPDRA
jgi:hypothetical protein